MIQVPPKGRSPLSPRARSLLGIHPSGSPWAFLKRTYPLFTSAASYFESHCFLGASLITRGECDARYEVGVDKIMYGSDFPHSEGTYPYTREAIRLVFETVPDDELLDMLAANAARLYGLDMSLLQGHADRVGPTLADLRRPLRADELPKDSASPTFGAQAGFQK